MVRDLSPIRRRKDTTLSFTGVTSGTWRLSCETISSLPFTATNTRKMKSPAPLDHTLHLTPKASTAGGEPTVGCTHVTTSGPVDKGCLTFPSLDERSVLIAPALVTPPLMTLAREVWRSYCTSWLCWRMGGPPITSVRTCCTVFPFLLRVIWQLHTIGRFTAAVGWCHTGSFRL